MTALPHSIEPDPAPAAVPADVAPASRSRRRRDRLAILLFAAPIFLGAMTMFIVEPLVAKMVVPLYGGTPSVWNTAMVFFQALLLLGYAYAHGSLRWLGPKRQPYAHALVLLLPLALLPVALPHGAAPAVGASPLVSLVTVFGVMVAVPFFVIASASPIIQGWFAQLDHPAAKDPYFLYAASNAGSLIGLLAYPLVVEPFLTIDGQSRLFSILYVGFATLSVACAATLLRSQRGRGANADVVDLHARRRERDAAIPAPTWRQRGRFAAFALVPSSLLLGATTYLTTDIASVPLLWMVPLSTYLLTLILAFSGRVVLSIRASGHLLAIAAAPVALGALGLALPTSLLMASHVTLLFAAGMLLHGRLAEERPHATHLTEFYLLVSLGGVLGGLFNVLVAPVVFESVIEYPLMVVIALLLRPRDAGAAASRSRRVLDVVVPVGLVVVGITGASMIGSAVGDAAFAWSLAAVVVVGVLTFGRNVARTAAFIGGVFALSMVASAVNQSWTERNFFGVVRVTDEGGQRHGLAHGTTLHGLQDLAPGRRSEPLTYYSRSGPVGDVFARLDEGSFDEIGGIGLGAGSIAAYGRQGQEFTFYEIDPAVIDVATDERQFTYLSDTPADIRIIEGDGRLELAKSRSEKFDLLVLDAFSSDSVPHHLLTKQAFGSYLDRLDEDGVLMFHITSRHLDLEPVIAAVARDLDLPAVVRHDSDVSARLRREGVTPAHWVVLARDASRFEALADAPDWRQLRDPGTTEAWTDDYSNIFHTIKW